MALFAAPTICGVAASQHLYNPNLWDNDIYLDPLQINFIPSVASIQIKQQHELSARHID